MKSNFLSGFSFVMIVIGGINWGFYGIFGWDVISSVFGDMTMTTRIIDIIIGISGVYRIATWVEQMRAEKRAD